MAAVTPADTVWELRTAGSDTLNSGGFSAANQGATGVDYSQQDGPQKAFTSTLSATGTTTLTDSGAGFLNTYLGNAIVIAGQGTYIITGFTSTSAVTVDRALGIFVTTSGAIGGACKTPGQVLSVMAGGNVGHVKSGTYSMTSAAAGAAGIGTLPAGTTARMTQLIGYGTTRGDNGTMPVFQGNVAMTLNTSMVTLSQGCRLDNLSFDGNLQTNSRAITGLAGADSFRCKIAACKNSGGSVGTYILCEVTGCTTAGQALAGGTIVKYCYIHDNTVTGLSVASGGDARGNIVVNNTGSTTDGVALTSTSAGSVVEGNRIYGNGRDGIRITAGATRMDLIGNIVYGNGATGGSGGIDITATAADDGIWLYYNAVGVAVSANITASHIIGGITLTADPFVNRAGGNWDLNTNTGGGALVRGLGFPSASGIYAYPGLSTPNYPDVGGGQHQDAPGALFLF